MPLQLTRPVTKIGLIAPFEGKQRAIGYEGLYAVKLALQEKNKAGGVEGWSIELVALDDSAQLEQGLQQARVLAADPDVTSVIVLTSFAQREQWQGRFVELGLHLLVVNADSNSGALPDAAFVERYQLISNGVVPGRLAVRMYGATQSLLSRLQQQIRTKGKPTR